MDPRPTGEHCAFAAYCWRRHDNNMHCRIIHSVLCIRYQTTRGYCVVVVVGALLAKRLVGETSAPRGGVMVRTLDL